MTADEKSSIRMERQENLDQRTPIGVFRDSRAIPPFSWLDIEELSVKNSRRQDATTVYADLDGFTAYVSGEKVTAQQNDGAKTRRPRVAMSYAASSMRRSVNFSPDVRSPVYWQLRSMVTLLSQALPRPPTPKRRLAT